MRQPAYDGWTRERLLEEVKKLKKRKKYGIVWEHKPEDVVEQCKRELPVLKEVKLKEIITDPTAPMNLLIEGDNYHALSVLNYTHKGKISVIYIDPPFNTGSRDWKYNNDYVDDNDSFRHSKWLSMMSSRLTLAKHLLKRDGVLICAIDENEQAHLGVLLEELFPAHERHCVTVIHNPGGIQGNNFSYNHEYAYFVYPSKGTYITAEKRIDAGLTPFRDWGKENSKREGARNCFYPIFVRNNKILRIGRIPEDDFHPNVNQRMSDGSIAVYPIDSKGVERRWRFARDSVDAIISELVPVIQGELISISRAKQNYTRKTVWDDAKFNANIYGTQLLSKILDTRFPFPKSLYLVRECIDAVKHTKDAIVLDFFAGSGTTGHAVMMLNKEDGGNRKFILVTNNENKIAEEVTYARIKKAIKGVKGFSDITKFGANLRYFKTSFVGAEPTDANKEALTAQAAEMLCVREDTFDPVKTTKAYKIFRSATRHTGIVFDPLALTQFRKELDRIKGNWSVYVFSLGDDTFDEEFADLGQRVKVSPVPEAILRVYRRIFSSDNNYGA